MTTIRAQTNVMPARLDIYVSDINGLDTNNGLTPAAAVKTLAGALARIPYTIISYDVVIHVGAHAGAGYTWATIDGYTLIDGASIYVYGDGAGQPGEDGFTVVVGPTLALAGSDDTKVVSAALGVDAYFGNTIEILTGAAAGDRRTIKKNTATDILPPTKFTAAVGAGDSYRIVRPAVEVVLPAMVVMAVPPPAGAATVLCAHLGGRRSISPADGGADDLVAESALMVVNIAFEAAAGSLAGLASWKTIDSLVYFFGVSLPCGAWMVFGEVSSGVTTYTEFDGPTLLEGYAAAQLPALLVSTTSWLGWGTNASGFLMSKVGSGLLAGIYVTAGGSFSCGEGDMRFYAGRTLGGTVGGGGMRCTVRVTLGTYGAGSSVFLGVTVETTGATPCLGASDGCTIDTPNLGSSAPLTLISVTGTGILVSGPDAIVDCFSGHSYSGGFSLTTGGWGVSCKKGGRAILDHDMYNFITAALGAFTLDEVVGETWPAGSHAGWFISAPDGSAIISAD